MSPHHHDDGTKATIAKTNNINSKHRKIIFFYFDSKSLYIRICLIIKSDDFIGSNYSINAKCILYYHFFYIYYKRVRSQIYE